MEKVKVSIIETHWDLSQYISARKIRRVKKRTSRDGINVRPAHRSRRAKR